MNTLERRILRLEEAQRQRESAEKRRRLAEESRVQNAIADPYTWATQYTQTYNPHWVEEGRPSPYEAFPSFEEYPQIYDLFLAFSAERIHFIEKSRDMMITWACVAYLTNKAMIVSARDALFQTQTEKKAKQLIKYARCLYDRQPSWLKDAFPLAKNQSEMALNFAHGGGCYAIPGGADQIRSYHPWGYLLDEASFVVEAGECYNEALAAVKGTIILNSSAGPGWYADVRHDIIRNAEEG